MLIIYYVKQMKCAVTLLALVCVLGLASARPQKEGNQFTNEAIRQAQNTFLIPKDAEIQNVQEAIELSAIENIPGNQRIDLAQILGAHVPAEVVANLQSQVANVGAQWRNKSIIISPISGINSVITI